LGNIKKIHPYLNNRLKLELQSEFGEDIVLVGRRLRFLRSGLIVEGEI